MCILCVNVVCILVFVCCIHYVAGNYVCLNGTLIIPISALKHPANLTVQPVGNSCQRQPLPRLYGVHIHKVLGILQSWYVCFMPEIDTIDLSEIY